MPPNPVSAPGSHLENNHIPERQVTPWCFLIHPFLSKSSIHKKAAENPWLEKVEWGGQSNGVAELRTFKCELRVLWPWMSSGVERTIKGILKGGGCRGREAPAAEHCADKEEWCFWGWRRNSDNDGAMMISCDNRRILKAFSSLDRT